MSKTMEKAPYVTLKTESWEKSKIGQAGNACRVLPPSHLAKGGFIILQVPLEMPLRMRVMLPTR